MRVFCCCGELVLITAAFAGGVQGRQHGRHPTERHGDVIVVYIAPVAFLVPGQSRGGVVLLRLRKQNKLVLAPKLREIFHPSSSDNNGGCAAARGAR